MSAWHILTVVKDSQTQELGLVWAPEGPLGKDQVFGLDPMLVLQLGSGCCIWPCGGHG